MRCFSVSLLLALAAVSAWSQSASDVSLPVDTLELGEAVVDSTDRFANQIDVSGGTKWFRHWHPKFEASIKPGAGNSLPVGGLTARPNSNPGSKFPGVTFTGFNPPDPNIAVGPSYIVEVVNSDIAFYTKAGAKTFQQSIDNTGFFSGVAQTDFVFDPKCFYDAGSGRYFVVALEQRDFPQNSGLLLAVSDNSTPSGVWFKYRINTLTTRNGQKYWWDYPGFGYNKDGVVITGNMFSFTTNDAFARSVALRKSPLLSGSPVSTFFFNMDGYFTIMPARTLDALATSVYGISLDTTSRMRMFAWRNLTATPSLVQANLTVPTYNVFNGYAQSTGGKKLDAVSDRMMDAAHRSGYLVCAHTVKVSSTDNRAMVRWYEIGTGTWPTSGVPTRRQSGNISLAAPNNIFLPAITKSGKGTIAVTFTRSSSAITADFFRTQRKVTDPLNSMAPMTKIAGSLSSVNSTQERWGDYFGIAIDPLDSTKFWAVGQVVQADKRWRTEIASWFVP